MFISFGPFGKKRGFLGLDIGSYSLKLAEAYQKGSSIVINSFSQIRLPPDTVTDGMIKNKEAFLKALKELLDNLKPRTHLLNTGLYAYTTFYERIPLSFVEEEDFHQAVLSEIESFVPFDLSDIYIDYVPFIKEKDKYEIIFATAKKENVDTLLEIFSELNLTVNAIDVDVFAISNLLEFLYGPNIRLVIDIGFSKTLTVFIDKLGPLFSREIAYGLSYILKNISQELDVPLDEAEKLQFSFPDDERGYAIKEIYTEFLRNLVEEIENSFNIFKGKYYMVPKEIFIIGGGSNIPGFSDFIRDQFKIEVKGITLNSKLSFSGNFDENYISYINRIGAFAVAQAIREFIA
ncbi:pilus assembly protein PilM [Thermosulfurimonas sp. F29]|uniref:pilus assembly protein PilM n=1 Tax=Thermosulfurimonas sp. F29 TaxID=2867247 RepID=UPI001C82D0CE|nr:pilus assembly protein PilM [Thermosulfurimonas sp. F29]MBX6423657.1 pilus assembly protein PilM [Thermosulfurimonas sp. F29]